MVDQVTSVDQSRQLIEAGVPTSAASMLWVHKVVDAVDGVTSHDAWELYLLSSFRLHQNRRICFVLLLQ